MLSQCAYSQTIKDINRGLATGLECCERVELLSNEVIYLDSINQLRELQISNQKNQLFLSNANTEISELRESSLLKEVQQKNADLAREHRRKRTFRTLWLISTGLLAGYYGYNQIK